MHLTTDEAWLRAACAKASSFRELVGLAIHELSKFKDKAEIVCGPITTGGKGSTEENLKVFRGAIAGLAKQGRPIFNQMPYEDALFRLRAEHPSETGRAPGDTSYNPLVLKEFYLPLFMTECFSRAWFLPDWRSSHGARWERRMFSSLYVLTTDISDEHLAVLLEPA